MMMMMMCLCAPIQYSTGEIQNAELKAELEIWKSMFNTHFTQQQQPVRHRLNGQQQINEQNTVDALRLEVSQLQCMLEVHVLLRTTAVFCTQCSA